MGYYFLGIFSMSFYLSFLTFFPCINNFQGIIQLSLHLSFSLYLRAHNNSDVSSSTESIFFDTVKKCTGKSFASPLSPLHPVPPFPLIISPLSLPLPSSFPPVDLFLPIFLSLSSSFPSLLLLPPPPSLLPNQLRCHQFWNYTQDLR